MKYYGKFIIGLFFFILSFSIITAQEISADFFADTTSGCTPLNVEFHNTSTPDSGLSYYWDFGNNTFSTLKNPSTIFILPGEYSITLIITKGTEKDTLTKQQYIEVHGNPIASFNLLDNSNGCAPYLIGFQDNSHTQNDTISYWLWDFGDGNYSEQQNPSHNFINKGNYEVTLYIEDVFGCFAVYTKSNAVSVHKPTADFSADVLFSCEDTLETNFKNLSVPENISSTNWNFGDGTQSNSNNPTHLYTSTGNFDVKLIVTDTYGCKDTLLKESYISNQHITAGFQEITYNLCAHSQITFTNTSENATNFLWDFGDGHTSTIETPTHTYNEAEIFNISLISSNPFGCSDTAFNIVKVEEVTANFEIDRNYGCSVPDTFYYTNLSENANYYIWHFGNGNNSYETNPNNIFETAGVFSDTLIAIGNNGCRDIFIMENSVQIIKPGAYFTPNNWVKPYDIMGCVPKTVNFEDATIYNSTQDSVIEWFWDFGDGTTSTEKDPIHIFSTLDTFLVTLDIKTAVGCVSEYGAWASTGTKQHAEFATNYPDTICASSPIQFHNLSTDPAYVNLSYWLFGDSTYSTLFEPLHFFTDTGYMDVKLTVYNNGCPDDTIIENFIYVLGPYHDLDYDFDCEDPYTINFTGNIIDATSFSWDFGDGTLPNTTDENPTHTFTEKGLFFVSLQTSNGNSGCSLNSSSLVQIEDLTADFNISDNKICQNSTVLFNSANSTDFDVFSYNDDLCFFLWDFGDNTQKESSLDTIISHKYNQEGNFEVKLIVQNSSGCIDSIIKTVEVHKPHADISADIISGCTPLIVNFSDTATHYFPITEYFWEFGDDSTSVSQNPNHIYTQNGSFDVIIKLKDEQGCIGRDTFFDFIYNHKPIPDFSASKSNICEGDEINFHFIEQTDSISTILWDFGDGTTSSVNAPSHIYENAGYYNVSLTLVDQNSCDSTISIDDFIYVQSKPIADFTADTTNSNCYPLLVHFSDNTTYSTEYSRLWQLNNNVISTLQNPTYTYTRPGDYGVTLTVTSTNGCSSSITKSNFISIEGPYCNMQIPDTVCKFIDYQYSITDLAHTYDIQWFMGEGSTSFDSTLSFTYQNSGTYYPIVLLRSDNINTCNKFFFDSVFVREIDAGFMTDNGTQGCVPFELIFTDTTSHTSERIWDFNDGTTGSTEMIFHPYNTPGEYNITMYETDIFGCKDTVNQTFNAFALPEISSTPDTFICLGDNINLQANGAQSYTWYPNQYIDNPYLQNPTSNTTESIDYQITGVDSNGCVNYTSTFIEVIFPPSFSVFDTALIIGDTIILNNYYDNILSYSWTPNVGISCDTCSLIQISPMAETVYTLTITDTSGCFELTKTFLVDVYLEYSLDVPTAFSPNGDGINDIIFVDGWGIQYVIFFNIYNRLGELVFTSNDINTGWDGTYKGKPQPVETYRYDASVMSYDGNIRTKSGTIKLIH
ncbi:MAG: PKD domain-containing protein [Bacteroidales bacterium]|nr:PKD domain-containing protein [Bacteroidales bacterium]